MNKTLAHFVTLIVLLILATVSLNAVFSDKGIFNRAEDAGVKYNEAKAREVLETVLLVDGQYEKNMNPAYNQDDFLDELIKREIEGADVKGDIAIISGKYAYELDRSVPKIGKYLGNSKDLIWPEVVIVNEPTLIENGRKSKFKIRATIDEKATKGITRIELWLNGKKLDQDRKYDNAQREVEEEYTVSRNGVYTIKAYAELMGSNKVTVEGIVPAVRFSPNGSTEWKKQHTTEIIVEETAETITEMKYIWTNSEDEPSEFTTDCLNNRIVTGGNETMTGTYYLWVLLTIGTGENQKVNIGGSQGFNFDNEVPTGELTSEPTSETSFTLTATANDNHSGIAKYEFYLDKKLVKTIPELKGNIEYKHTTTSLAMGRSSVTVYDKAGNTASFECDYRTYTHTWKKYNCIITRVPVEHIEDTTYELSTDPIFKRFRMYERPTLVSIATGNAVGLNYKHTGGAWYSENNWVYNDDNTGLFLTNSANSNSYFIENYFELGAAIGWRTSEWRVFEAKHYTNSEEQVPSQGTEYIGEAYSTSINDYPENGEKDGIWYAYEGIT